MKWQIWQQSWDDMVSHSIIPVDSNSQMVIKLMRDEEIEGKLPNVDLLHEYDAISYNDAMQHSYDFLGFGVYTPLQGLDEEE